MDFSDSNEQTMDLSKKEMIMEQFKAEMSMQVAQELIAKINTKCFEKCIPKPGSKLSSSEQDCLSRCSDRYMEAWNLVAKVLTKNSHA